MTLGRKWSWENAITKLSDDDHQDKITFEKLPDTLPNGNKPFVPPGGPPNNQSPDIRAREDVTQAEENSSLERQRSRHKTGSVRFGKVEDPDQRTDAYGRENDSGPTAAAMKSFQNAEQSEVDQNYSIGRYPQDQQYYRGSSAPEAEAYQQPKNYHRQSLPDERDPFSTDQTQREHRARQGPDKSIARPRPRPGRQQSNNPFTDPNNPAGDPGNPFNDGAW